MNSWTRDGASLLLHAERRKIYRLAPPLACVVALFGGRIWSPAPIAQRSSLAGLWRPSWEHARFAAPDDCTVTVVQRQRAVLPDSVAVSVNATSIAVNDRSIMVLGTPTLLWRRGPGGEYALVRADSVIGLLRDRHGVLRTVPAPPTGQPALFPRAASAGADGWHVLFVTRPPGSSPSAVRVDSADVWYGLYTSRGWRDVQRLGVVRHANLSPRSSSDLVASARTLSFAFPFDASVVRKSNAAGNQGLVLLQRRGMRWRYDTLRTWESPDYVQLAPDSQGDTLTVAIVQSRFESHRVWPPTLFLATYDSGWHDPRRVLRSAGDPANRDVVLTPVVLAHAGGIVVAWQAAHDVRFDSVHIDWATLTKRDSIAQPTTIASGRTFDMFAIVALDARRTLWLGRNGPASSDLRLILGTDSTTTDLGVVTVPLSNFVTLAAVPAEGTVLVVTGEVSASRGDPPSSTYLTQLRLSCIVKR